jgi:hypothetical protein
MLESSDGLKLRMDTLRNLSRVLAQPLDERGVLRAVHAELSRALDITMCFFGRFDPGSQTVEVIWQMHEGHALPGGQFPLGSGPTSQAIRTRQHRVRDHDGPSKSQLTALRLRVGRLVADGQEDVEGAPAPGPRAFCPDAPTVPVHNVAGDIEPQPDAGGRA